MSRVSKYKESIQKFIKDKYSTIDDDLLLKLNNNDMIFSIFCLTIMNNQNKKKKLSMQGYHIGVCVELVNLALSNVSLSQRISLIYMAHLCLLNNYDSIKTVYNPSEFNTLIRTTSFVFNKFLNTLKTVETFKNETVNIGCHHSIVDWYSTTDVSFKKRFVNLKQVTKKSMHEYIELRYVTIAELALIFGWTIGGEININFKKLSDLAKNLAIIYKLSVDFINLESDLRMSKDFTMNYVLNYGFQDSYELFLENKHLFIEGLLKDDFMTITIKELMEYLEKCIDDVIEKTTPDLKSSYSSKKI